MRILKNMHFNNKGVTLIEIIISFALLSIVILMAIIVFGSGIALAINSGDDTNVTTNAVQAVNTEIVAEFPTGDANTAVVHFNFANKSNTNTVSGTVVVGNSSSDQNEAQIASFVPEE